MQHWKEMETCKFSVDEIYDRLALAMDFASSHHLFGFPLIMKVFEDRWTSIKKKNK